MSSGSLGAGHPALSRRGTPGAIAAQRGTIVDMGTESLRTVRDHLSEYVDRAARLHERTTITKNGRRVAVLISAEDLDALEETVDILSDPDAMRELAEAEKSIAAGDGVRGVEAIRALRSRGA